MRDVEDEDRRVHDYLDVEINSPRDGAVQAALEYARWIANHTKQVEGGLEMIPDGLSAMPEIRRMLKWLTLPENGNFEVMAVIGAHINSLYWIDRAWLAENADRIFGLQRFDENPAEAYGWAAWDAFLVWLHPHVEYYRAFRSQFAYAVEQASRVKLPERSDHQPMYYLGEHLVVLYGRGQLGLDDDGQVLRRLLSRAIPAIRRHAVGFVGRSLSTDGELPPGVVQRFIDLWDWYWPTCGRADAKEKPEDWLFGPWFISGKFPAQWVSSWLEDAEKILKLGLRAEGGVRESASLVIDYLGRRGDVNWRTATNRP